MVTKSAVSTQDADATRRVQELLERGCMLGVAIDANCYITQGGGNLNVSFRPRLVSGNKSFRHLIPSVWEREIKRHIRSRVEDAKEKALNLSGRDISILDSPAALSAIKALQIAVEAVDAAQIVDSLWAQFVAETHATIVDPPPDSATTVLAWYFGKLLPFEGAGDKKNEFPDAFALHSLSQFASDNKLHIVVVVTKDSGAYGHCKKVEKLLAFRDIQTALSAFDTKELIEQRRYLSAKVCRAMDEKHLAKLIERLIGHINQLHEHRPQPWGAITKPGSFPYQRIIVDELLKYELVPFGNFDMPIIVTWINTAGIEGWPGAGLRIKVRIRAMVSCEIGAIDKNDRANKNFRQRIPIEGPVDADVTFSCAAPFPLSDDDPAAWVFEPTSGIPFFDQEFADFEVDPLHVTVPDNFEAFGIA